MPKLPKEDAKLMLRENDEIEERVLRRIDDLEDTPGVDLHWIEVGREHLEHAFMCLNRAIASPDRISLPEDE